MLHERKIPEVKPEFIKRMQKLLPEKSDFQNYLEILKQQPVKSIRCNTLKISPEELKLRLEKKGWLIKQPWAKNPEVIIVEGKIASDEDIYDKTSENYNKDFSDINVLANNHNKKSTTLKPEKITASERFDFGKNLKTNNKVGAREEVSSNLIDLEPGELGRALEHVLGYYYIQELASMLPIIALEPKPNELVLDLCSSPGSKTTQIAAKMQNTGTIIANEVSLGRIKILATNLERCGVTNAIITRKEGAALCNRLKNKNFQFDKILIDAPCSGEGTLRSSYKTYAMWNPKTITSLSRTQKMLVESAIDILKPNGILVYSTCTHAPEENEEIVNYILNKFEGSVEIESIKLPIECRPGVCGWENNKFNPKVKKSCRVYPHDNNTEGFFIAKLRKIK